MGIAAANLMPPSRQHDGKVVLLGIHNGGVSPGNKVLCRSQRVRLLSEAALPLQRSAGIRIHYHPLALEPELSLDANLQNIFWVSSTSCDLLQASIDQAWGDSDRLGTYFALSPFR